MTTAPGDKDFDMIREVLLDGGGACVVEHLACVCGKRFVSYHPWSESLECPSCKARVASRVPRRPGQGEVTLGHVTAALEQLTQCYTNSVMNKFSSEAEWASLDDKIKLMIQQNMVAAVVAALRQVDSLAVALAGARE